MEEIALSKLYLILLILILLSGFFSGSETGLMAINKYRLRHLANKGHRGAKLAQKLLHTPDRLIGLILLGNNLVNILAASIATVIGIRLFGVNGVWIASLILTVVILIFSEVAPKTVAAVQDTIIYETDVNNNFGIYPSYITYKSTGASYRTLLRFDLSAIPADAGFTSASLHQAVVTSDINCLS
ncbi:MAG: CNNM domain-containing protein, partial [Xanthomonadales bacterium]|nr:CNNM domain-containing protein [Xanthomonadales bacterium]